jgi:hypothetical protein
VLNGDEEQSDLFEHRKTAMVAIPLFTADLQDFDERKRWLTDARRDRIAAD